MVGSAVRVGIDLSGLKLDVRFMRDLQTGFGLNDWIDTLYSHTARDYRDRKSVV
jgi:hypothetical protein